MVVGLIDSQACLQDTAETRYATKLDESQAAQAALSLDESIWTSMVGRF